MKWAALGGVLGILFALYQVFGRNMYHGQEAVINVVALAIEFGLIGAAVAAAKNWTINRRTARNLPASQERTSRHS